MLRFSANLGFLWTDLALTDAIKVAASNGFDAVECHWPFDVSSKSVDSTLKGLGLPMVSLNTRPGDLKAGDFGIAAVPGREAQARSYIKEAIIYAEAVDAHAVHVMAGRTDHGEAAEDCFRDNLIYASEIASLHDIEILIEPINRNDVTGYHLAFIEDAVETIEATKCKNIRLMFDCYHVQITQGDTVRVLRDNIEHIGHIQIAAVPDRGEPDSGVLDYRKVFSVLEELNYDGFLGAEYRPRKGTTEGLGWLNEVKSWLS
jgi:hydroxypyruvate isomerase